MIYPFIKPVPYIGLGISDCKLALHLFSSHTSTNALSAAPTRIKAVCVGSLNNSRLSKNEAN